MKNTSKAAKDTAQEVLSFTQEKRKGQRFSYLLKPLTRHGGSVKNTSKAAKDTA